MLHRRDALLRIGQATLGGLSLPGLLRAEHQPAPQVGRGSTAKSCILIYLWGGPPQMDMWDMKPFAPDGIRSPFLPISTSVPGIQISDQLPLTAQQADKFSIVRSYTHPSNQHEVGVYHTLTGKVDNTLAVPRNQRSRHDFPNMAGVVSRFSPPMVMPASVTVPRPIGHDGVTYMGTYAGFLGPRYDPVEIAVPGEVSAPAPHAIDPLPNLELGRLQARHGLVQLLDEEDRFGQSSEFARCSQQLGFDRFQAQAFALLTSPECRDAFLVDREPDAVRDRYGRNEYGESILLARRLIELGTRLVTMVWYYICPDGNVANVWDNHGGTASLGGISGYAMLKEKYCLPSLDQAFSALMEDLHQRGLLDETLVLMLGEFGRTPKINQNNGRDHWGPCQSVVLAGGGVRGGQVYGESDDVAAYPTRDAVSPEDFLATAYSALGLPPESIIEDALGRPHRIAEGQPVRALF